MMSEELLYCPSCNFTKEQFDKHQQKMGIHRVEWANYKPIIYRNRFDSLWIIECQNCGMSVSFNEDEKTSIELWNELLRK